jgi:hypothetical protein
MTSNELASFDLHSGKAQIGLAQRTCTRCVSFSAHTAATSSVRVATMADVARHGDDVEASVDTSLPASVSQGSRHSRLVRLSRLWFQLPQTYIFICAAAAVVFHVNRIT